MAKIRGFLEEGSAADLIYNLIGFGPTWPNDTSRDVYAEACGGILLALQARLGRTLDLTDGFNTCVSREIEKLIQRSVNGRNPQKGT
jgi:hypothetical protein